MKNIEITNKQIEYQKYLKGTKHQGSVLLYIPEELSAEELCLIAITHYGYTIEHVPKELRTEKLCLEAVKKDGFALRFVPEEFLRLILLYLS